MVGSMSHGRLFLTAGSFRCAALMARINWKRTQDNALSRLVSDADGSEVSVFGPRGSMLSNAQCY